MEVAGGTGGSVTGMCRLTAVVCAHICQLRPAWKCSLACPRIGPGSASWKFSDEVDFSWEKNIFVKSDMFHRNLPVLRSV